MPDFFYSASSTFFHMAADVRTPFLSEADIQLHPNATVYPLVSTERPPPSAAMDIAAMSSVCTHRCVHLKALSGLGDSFTVPTLRRLHLRS